MCVESVMVPCGGGGLTAGIALAARHMSRESRICAVEPEHYDDTAGSLRARTIVPNSMEQRHPTLCDALMVARPGALTFEINRQLVSEARMVSDTDVCEAVRWLARELRLAVEPSGAAGLAALFHDCKLAKHDCVAVIVSGGNIALGALAQLCKETDLEERIGAVAPAT